MSGPGQDRAAGGHGSVAAVLCLLFGAGGAATGLSADAVFIALFLSAAGLATLPLALSDLRHLVTPHRQRATKQAVAGGVLSLVGLGLVGAVLVGSEQRADIRDSASPAATGTASALR